ncbi:hypothetical protein LOK49_LG02G03813 [Camellia lanceoleosa]|uniref:Uncharacterized protein n=1 Tax=Camellia lanceoleosa TaxID=1840588 RepID=A0ACC0IHN1_9ERIC|nr:hypothetical protein LOK49_LG02G03813 [Camellia lanceoleosa]
MEDYQDIQPWEVKGDQARDQARGFCLESVLSANLCASRGGSGYVKCYCYVIKSLSYVVLFGSSSHVYICK